MCWSSAIIDQSIIMIRQSNNIILLRLYVGDLVIGKPYQEGDSNQQWERHENTIRNRRSHKVLDILGMLHLPHSFYM